eukprot:TRINITY_DN9141_c0_g2_i1.p1 TRINITY_DN9141_c0_g2~~TRINITY_DN9141_c0_g2_i1.p1  ORF type:complete len:957 (+),score=173.86 TRINITY_DN9141_c0_g2_i1:140-2872(+)
MTDVPSTNRLPSMQEPVFRQNILARVSRIDEVLAADRAAWPEVQGRLVDVEKRLADLEQQACTFTVMNSFRAEAQAHIAEMSDKLSSLAVNSCTYQQVESLRGEVDCMRDSFCTVNQLEALQQQMSDDLVRQQRDFTCLRSSIEAVSSWQSSGEAEAMIHAGVMNVVQQLCPRVEENCLSVLAPRLEAVEAKCHTVELELENISNTTRLQSHTNGVQTENTEVSSATAQFLENLISAHRVEWSAALTDLEVRSEAAVGGRVQEQLKVHRAEVSAALDDLRRRTEVDGNRDDRVTALHEECAAALEELRKCPKESRVAELLETHRAHCSAAIDDVWKRCETSMSDLKGTRISAVEALLNGHVSRLRTELDEGMEELRQTGKVTLLSVHAEIDERLTKLHPELQCSIDELRRQIESGEVAPLHVKEPTTDLNTVEEIRRVQNLVVEHLTKVDGTMDGRLEELRRLCFANFEEMKGVSKVEALINNRIDQLRTEFQSCEAARSSTSNTARELSQERDRDVVSQAVAEAQTYFHVLLGKELADWLASGAGGQLVQLANARLTLNDSPRSDVCPESVPATARRSTRACAQTCVDMPRLKESIRHMEGGMAFLLTSVGASQEKIRQLSTTVSEIDEFVKLAKKEDVLNRPSATKAILELQRVEDLVTKRLAKTEQLVEFNDAKLKQQVGVVSSLQQTCDVQRHEHVQAESRNNDFMDETRRKLQALISKLDLLPGQPPTTASCVSSRHSASTSGNTGVCRSGETSPYYTRVGDHSTRELSPPYCSRNDSSASTIRGGSATFPLPCNLKPDRIPPLQLHSLNDRDGSAVCVGSTTAVVQNGIVRSASPQYHGSYPASANETPPQPHGAHTPAARGHPPVLQRSSRLDRASIVGTIGGAVSPRRSPSKVLPVSHRVRP